MADYVALETSGHVLLEDGVSGLLLEVQTVTWTGSSTVSLVDTLTTAAKLTARSSSTVGETVTVTTTSHAVTLHGSTVVSERVTVTTRGELRMILAPLIPLAPGSLVLVPVSPSGLVLIPRPEPYPDLTLTAV